MVCIRNEDVICKNMKNLISLIIVFFVLICVSCSKETNKNEIKNTKLEEAKAKYRSEHSRKKNKKREIVVLLTMKYELPIDLTQKIMSEFLKKDSSLFEAVSLHSAKSVEEIEQLKSKFIKIPINERIVEFSIENNVSQSKIASLIIDYKIWYESQYQCN